MRNEDASPIDPDTFGIVHRAGCMWEECTSPETEAHEPITCATDDVTRMHRSCWNAYDRAWRAVFAWESDGTSCCGDYHYADCPIRTGA